MSDLRTRLTAAFEAGGVESDGAEFTRWVYFVQHGHRPGRNETFFCRVLYLPDEEIERLWLTFKLSKE